MRYQPNRLLFRQTGLFGLALLFSLAASQIHLFLSPKTYHASARIMIGPVETKTLKVLNESILPELNRELKSNSFQEAVVTNLEEQHGAKGGHWKSLIPIASDTVVLTQVPNSYIFDISVSLNDPEEAAQIANAFAATVSETEESGEFPNRSNLDIQIVDSALPPFTHVRPNSVFITLSWLLSGILLSVIIVGIRFARQKN